MKEYAGSRAIEILLVDDNPADVRLAQEALRETSAEKKNLRVVSDGVAALDFLRRRGPWGDAPRPDLILLDLNLPKKDGREVLAEIKMDEELRAIPVIVLTTSEDKEDVRRSYELHANCYISKPVGLDRYLEAVRRIDDFWLQLAQLPPR